MKKSPTWFDVYLVNVKSSGRLFQIFVAFLECLNFIILKKKSSNRNLIANLVYVPYLLSYVTIGVISNARAFFACVSFGVWHVRFSGHECEMWQNVRGSNGILGGLRSHTQWVEIVLIRFFFHRFSSSSGSNFFSILHNIRVLVT